MYANGHETQGRLLRRWFEASTSSPAAANARLAVWFEPDPTFDAGIRAEFGAEVEAAAEGQRDHWVETPRGLLSLVILLDQLPRNLYRGTPRAFVHDARAQDLCLQGLGEGLDAALHPVERGFLLLPLQHAENDELQARSIAEYERLVAGTPDLWHEVVTPFLARAREHDSVIARFGRFPDRNAILGRASTPEEIAFLASKGAPLRG
jgi:uncharacterized protein (DUF924 family)